jgi:hypothetical protein
MSWKLSGQSKLMQKDLELYAYSNDKTFHSSHTMLLAAIQYLHISFHANLYCKHLEFGMQCPDGLHELCDIYVPVAGKNQTALANPLLF